MKIKHIIYIALAPMLMLLSACNDDDSFTTSSSNQLTFSNDTVRLDTVFSKIPTATKTFWVYNRSGNGIRCTNIRLAKGNQTGFRVNVDGTYLGQTSGFQVNDIEIRNKDSIRVFVELTSPTNDKTDPQLVEDDLVFTLESGVQQKVNLNAYTWDATVLKDVKISSDETISSSRPIIIYGGIKVDSGAVLTIDAGTTLYFHANAGIDVYGQLRIKGSAERNVVLRGDRIDNMFDYLPYDFVSGQWNGIHLHSSSYDNIIEYADIHSAFNGLVCDSSDVERLKLSITNSTIHNCQGAGLMSFNSSLNIENCQITNTLDDCLAIYGGKANIMHCTLAQFYPFDSKRGASLKFSNTKDNMAYPLQNLLCVNTLITGYSDDVLQGIVSDDKSIKCDYKFDYCILRTPKIENDERFTNIIWEDPQDTIKTGRKNFRKIDTDNLRYDFRLDSASVAIGSANVENYLEYDRLGIRRDEKPDIGCYEYIKQE